jgi:RNA-directed DNA polymerase
VGIQASEDGFDFLGQNVRRSEGKVLLKPSRKNVQTFLAKIQEELRQHGGSLTAGNLIQRLNPKIRGGALYHRHASSKRTFAHVDKVIAGKVWRWARRRHRNKSAAWVKAKYFTRSGHREWVFCGTVPDDDGHPQGVTLDRALATRLERPVKVQGLANPYDPAWELYCEERWACRRASTLTGQGTARYLWLEQEGRCPVCRQALTLEPGWHVHHLVWRSLGGDDLVDNLVLLHPNCHRQVHGEGLVLNKVASREGRS